MKSLLIVSYHFAPQNKIGAVRMTKLAKYLSRIGYEVTVLCGAGIGELQDPILARDLDELRDVLVIREWNLIRDRKERVKAASCGEEQASASKPGRQAGCCVRHFLQILYLVLNQLSDSSFYRKGFRALAAMNRRFDVVLSSYGPLSNHRIAKKAKKRKIAEGWIADFRDVVSMPFWQAKGAVARYVQGVRKHADYLTVVSLGYGKAMGLVKEAVVVPNGYDAEDLQGIAEVRAGSKDRITFAYCGQMYGSQRDMRPFFRALRELVDEQAVDEERLAIQFAGKQADGEAFLEQASEFRLSERVINYGFIPRNRAIEIQLSADVILVAGWNTRQYPVDLPGKLLEVLMMHKPILCFIAGDVSCSGAAGLIAKTKTGYCHEAAVESSFTGLKVYMRNLLEALCHGPVPFLPDAEAVEQYAYPKLALRFTELIEGKSDDAPLTSCELN